MKFYDIKYGSDKAFIQKEADAWNKVYGKRFQCRLGRLPGGMWCLIMPYVFPLPEELRREFLENGTIGTALYKLVSHCVRHNEIKWRHVGLQEENGEEVHFIGFGDTEGLLTQTDADEYVESSLASLIETAGLPVDCDRQKLLKDAIENCHREVMPKRQKMR